MRIRGRVWKYGDNVNTDVIFPGKYTYTLTEPEEIARHALEDLDPDFASQVQPGDIVVGGRNWGCGSSREQAVTCLVYAGVGAVVAKSFARIFYRNAINQGLPALTCPEAVDALQHGEIAEIDLDRGIIRCAAGEFQFSPLSPSVRRIIDAGGLIPMLQSRRPQLVVIPGDGIGHEVVPAAVEVLRAAIPELETVPAEAGWACFQERGVSVPAETLAAIRQHGAALFGAVASPARKVEGYRSAIVTMRQELGLYANVRPIRSWPIDNTRQGIDLLIVRENTEGLYAGREHQEGDTAIAERVVTRQASARIARTAFELARQAGRRCVTIVHKANILPVSDGLFRDSVRQVAGDYPEVEVDELLVDTAALWLVRDPGRFDVIVTTNLFGDILSDAAAGWTGLGLAPSLNLGDELAVAEPVHGAAPDIVGQGIANPIAAILSGAMLTRYVWDMSAVATAIEQAVEATLAAGIRTPDIAGPGDDATDTAGMTQAIIARLQG